MPDESTFVRELWKKPDHIARLLCLPQKLSLSEESRRHIEHSLFQTAQYNISLNHLTKDLEKNDISFLAKQSIEEVEILLAQSIATQKPWKFLQPLWFKVYELKPSSEIAARLCENAFLYADEEVWLTLCFDFSQKQPSFYSQLHEHVRHALIAQSQDHEEMQTYILGHLIRSRQSDWLSSLEKVAVFAGLYKQSDPYIPWNYFCEHESCFLPVPLSSNIPEELLRLMIARLAVRVGEKQKARKVLSFISSDHTYYNMAQELIGDANKTKDALEKDYKWKAWTQTGSWQEQLKELGAWLQEAKEDQNLRSFLSQLLPDLSLYFEKDPVIWNELSTKLIQSGAGEYLDIFAFHTTQETVMHDAALEFALWRPLMNEDINPRWQSIALFHDFLASSGEHIESLWQATRMLKRIDFDLWRRIQRWGMKWSQTEGVLTEGQRLKIKHLLNGLAFEDHQDPKILETLLREQVLSLVVLHELFRSLKESCLAGFDDVLCLILRKISYQQCLEKEKLELFWEVTYKKYQGVAWRIATVAATRGVLSKKVESFWLGSGEKRERYPILEPASVHVDRCFVGMDPKTSRLVWSLMRIGPLLPELLLNLDDQLKVSKKKRSDREKSFDQHLKNIQWLGEPRVRVCRVDSNNNIPVPQFCKTLAPTVWAELCAHISEFMGLNHWGWSLERLRSVVEHMLPQNKVGYSSKPRDSRLVKWMRGLSPEQKAAWHDLTALVRKVEEKDGAMALATFVVRLTTLIYPSHYDALMSLRKMSAPEEVIWKLENWILSEEYAKTRLEQGLETQCPIPESLERVIRDV
ncbi:MAG: hypothetical protein AB8C84_07655 [Oligoflexales bacterium]